MILISSGDNRTTCMTSFTVLGDERSEGFSILCDGKEYIKVVRKAVWFDITSKFYLKDQLVLESVLQDKIFWLEIAIIRQKLEHHITVSKKNGHYYLQYGDNTLSFNTRIFRNPYGKIFKNNEQIGEITVFQGIAVRPSKFDFTFYEDDDLNYYSVLLFIMCLPIRSS